MNDNREFQSRMQHLDSLLQEAEESFDPASHSRLQEITSGLLDLHRSALERLLHHITSANDPGRAILQSCLRDPVVTGLLVLHNLHPNDLESRIRSALDKLSPFFDSHHQAVQLVSLSSEASLHLRVTGLTPPSANSCTHLKSTLEQELYSAAPELTSLTIDGLEPPPTFIPLAINGTTFEPAAL